MSNFSEYWDRSGGSKPKGRGASPVPSFLKPRNRRCPECQGRFWPWQRKVTATWRYVYIRRLHAACAKADRAACKREEAIQRCEHCREGVPLVYHNVRGFIHATPYKSLSCQAAKAWAEEEKP